MATHKTLQGILALVDIVNFTGQSIQLGEQYTAQYIEYFQEKITTISEKHEFKLVKSLGDAVLFFGASPEGILDIMLDFFHFDKPENKFGFTSRFRMVAHSGFFQFETKGDKLIDLVSPEGIKVFRMEKYAQSWELVVTHNLYQGIKPLLTQKNIEAVRMVLNEPLKGFDSDEWNPPFYKLRVIKENAGVSNLLEQRMNDLENGVQYIPVFGNIYPPVPMVENFINLSLVCDDDRFLKEFDQCLSEQDDDENGELKISRHLKKGEWPFPGIEMEEEFNRRSKFTDIGVKELYDKFPKGIIMGLPGAGKTTILRHIAYKEFKANESKPPDEKQTVLFVQCKDVRFYDTWYKERYSAEPGEPGREEALSFMTWGFLFGKRKNKELTPEEIVEFQNAEKKVVHAFNAKRLTLLVDALDEAGDINTRERIKQLFFVLNSENRMYLTSRPSEDIHLGQDIKRHNIPLFKVLSLTMDQVRNVAIHLMDEDSAVYKKFDITIWKEEVVVKMAATPLTALLVTAYFQVYEKFDHRFPMYDLLVKFILLKAWESIKTGMFPYKNMGLFFQEIKAPDFFDKHKETEILYHALASLCFDLFYEDVDGVVQRSITENVMEDYFIKFIKERMFYNYNEEAAKAVAAQWKERFHRDHLLLQVGAGRFVFVHSTFMEFLAAYCIVEQWKKNSKNFPELIRKCVGANYLELETVPIAAGNNLNIGYDLLRGIGGIVKEAPDKEQISRLGVKLLAEVEWVLHKTFSVIRMKSMRQTIEDTIDRNRDAVRWVYRYLKETLSSDNKEKLKEMARLFDGVSKLSLPTFLAAYMDYNDFYRGDSESVGLRRKLLGNLVQVEIIEQWFRDQKHKKEEIENILQLDSEGYHPDDKNFNYYRCVSGKELTGFFGSPNFKHSGQVNACAFSTDGTTILSASADYTLKLWDSESGKEIRSFTGHTNSVLGCDFSPDGKTILSASADNFIKLWDVGSGKENRTFTGHTAPVWSCTFSHDGKTILSASFDNTLKLWDTETGKEIRSFTGHTGSVFNCAFSPDGQTILSASGDTTLKLWDIETGKDIRTFTGHMEYVFGCAFSPDGQTILSASGDTTLKLWDVETGKEIRSFTGHTNFVVGCTFSPDGKTILSASTDKTLKLWDVLSGKEIRSFTGHMSAVTDCVFLPDGETILSVSYDKTLKLWDSGSGKEKRFFTGHKNAVWDCAFSPDGKNILSTSSDMTLKLWDSTSGEEIRRFIGHKDSVRSCSFSTKSTNIVSASWDDTLRLWDSESGKEIRSFTEHKSYVYDCAFSPDGKTILSASNDNTLKLWDSESGKEIRSFTGHTGPVWDCAFSPDGKTILSASKDNTLKLWDLRSGKEIRTFIGHTDVVNGCAFSPDGQTILSASRDGALKLWNSGIGNKIRSFTGHKDSVLDCAFSLDGKIVISVSYDHSLKLWDISSGKILKSIKLLWIPNRIAVAPGANKFIVITANWNGTVTMFDFSDMM